MDPPLTLTRFVFCSALRADKNLSARTCLPQGSPDAVLLVEQWGNPCSRKLWHVWCHRYSSRSRTKCPERPSGISSLGYPVNPHLDHADLLSLPKHVTHLQAFYLVTPSHLPEPHSSWEAYRLPQRHSQLPGPTTLALSLEPIFSILHITVLQVINLTKVLPDRQPLQSWDKFFIL